jgi:hypothetical protein
VRLGIFANTIFFSFGYKKIDSFNLLRQVFSYAK